jgi:hypothetical protein
MLAEHQDVHFAQKADGVEVLPAAVHVGDPFAGVAAVVEIKHGRDGIDPQRVDMEAFQPV